MNDSKLIEIILTDIAGKKVSPKQIDFLKHIYNTFTKEGTEVLFKPTYNHKTFHPSCSFFMNIGNENWDSCFRNLDQFKTWIKQYRFLEERVGEYRETNSFMTYFFEKSGICTSFVYNGAIF